MRKELRDVLSGLTIALTMCAALAMTSTLVGCQAKEKVLDVETPAGELEVERDKENGDVEVEVNEN